MMNTLVTHLSDSLIDEIVAAVGLPTTRFNHCLFWRLFRKITDRFADLGASVDAITKSSGLPAASEWALTHFCSNIQVHGVEHIPDQGPLLVLSNHPGAYDALIIFSNLRGHTIQSVSSSIPFLNLMPNTGQHFLFAPRDDARERMIVLRRAIQHLKEGGALNYFGSGHRDPDPSAYPGAIRAIDHWLDVFDTFFRYVKDLRVIPMIISGVISAKWVNHPITWFRKRQIDRQRLAEFGQVITQLRTPGRLMMTPKISIGKPFSEDDLRRVAGQGKLFHAVTEQAKVLFMESSSYFGDFYISKT
jgi:1-acyl-sn-glycerol-3-phosphate acyltransferase